MFLAVATRVLTLQAACRGTKPHYSPKVQGPQVSAHVPWAGSGESKIHQARPPALAHHHQLDLGLESQTAQPRQETHLVHDSILPLHHGITTSQHQLIQQTHWIFEYLSIMSSEKRPFPGDDQQLVVKRQNVGSSRALATRSGPAGGSSGALIQSSVCLWSFGNKSYHVC